MLKITQSIFLITLVVLNEAIGVVNNLSKILQKESLQLSFILMLISFLLYHLQNILEHCLSTDKNNLIHTNKKALINRVFTFCAIIQNENKMKSFGEPKILVIQCLNK